MRIRRPCFPSRSWIKNGEPGLVSLIQTAKAPSTGKLNRNAGTEIARSKVRFSSRFDATSRFFFTSSPSTPPMSRDVIQRLWMPNRSGTTMTFGKERSSTSAESRSRCIRGMAMRATLARPENALAAESGPNTFTPWIEVPHFSRIVVKHSD